MDVVCTSEIDATEHERFLDGFAVTPGSALAYHYPFYLDFLAKSAYPRSVVRLLHARNDRGELAGMMPAVHVNTGRVNAWMSLAYFGPNAGALVRDEDSAEGRAMATSLVSAAKADAVALGCGSMTLYTPLHSHAELYHRALGGVDFDVERIAQCLQIPGDPGQSPWPRKVRYDIRRATSLGVAVRAIANETEFDAVWTIYRAGCEEAGIPIKALEHVRTLYRTAGRHGVFLLAEHEGEIVAGLIALMGGGVLSYYLPCTRSDRRSLQPGLALLDRAVAIAREAGCRLLNFEASPSVESSVYKFKARCGGEPAAYRVLVKLLRPGVLEEYRALGPEGLRAEAPHAFIVPFQAIAS